MRSAHDVEVLAQGVRRPDDQQTELMLDRLTERRERLDTYDAERQRRAIARRIRAALMGA